MDRNYHKGMFTPDLHVESLQDSQQYHGKQKNIGGSLTVGVGVSGSASFNKSKINANHKTVAEQSGILTGDDGFQVNVTDHTELKGGIITSTAQAEADGKNSFSTGTISISDLDNHSDYKAKGIGLSGGMTLNSGWDGAAVDKKGKPVSGVNKAIGYGSDSDQQNNVTISGIGTKNITVGNVNNSDLVASLTTTKTTDEVLADTGLQNQFDKAAVQNEMDLQVGVTQEFDTTRQTVKKAFNEKIASVKEQVKQGKASQAELDNLQTASLLVDGITGALYAPNSNGLIGDVAQVASPQIAKQIGDYFAKNGDNKAAHGVAHTVLAAAVAAAGGNDALTAGLSAGGAELAAPVVSKFMFGTDNPDDLTVEQKQTISSITSLVGTAAGATTDNVTDIATSTQAATNAVDNNHLKHNDILALGRDLNSILAERKRLESLKSSIGDDLDKQKAIEAALAKNDSAMDTVLSDANNLSKILSNVLHDKKIILKDGLSLDSSPIIDAGELKNYLDGLGIPKQYQSKIHSLVLQQGKDTEFYADNNGFFTPITIGRRYPGHPDYGKDPRTKEEKEQIGNIKREQFNNAMDTADAISSGLLPATAYLGGLAIGDEATAENAAKVARPIADLISLNPKLTVANGITNGRGIGKQSIIATQRPVESLKLGARITREDTGIQWGKGINNQGKPWETYLQGYLPEGTLDLNTIKSNFKTFDHLLPDGTAISAKTMDTVGSKTYSKPSNITRTLNKYVDQMVKFDKDGKGANMIRAKDISAREMYLAIPAQTTKQQRQAIQKSIDYAKSHDTNIIVKEIK